MSDRLLRIVLAPLGWLLYVLSGFCPRDRNKYAFGAPKDRFADNSKHLFLEAAGAGMSVAWITGRDSIVQQLRAQGLPAYRRWSLAGLWWALRSKTYVVSCYADDVNFWASRRARLVSLWHGVPLKRIERSVRTGPISRRFYGTLAQRLPFILLAPHVYRKPDVLLVPSPELLQIFGEAFGVDLSRMVVGGYPRNAVLSSEGHPLRRTRTNLTSEESSQLFGASRPSSAEKLVLYAPTWRDDGRDFVGSCPIDWGALDRELAAKSMRLTVRLHPASRLGQWPPGLSRVTLERAIDDIYPYLPLYDCLVTDYSSIYLDFLYLDRRIVFYPYDLDKYRSDTRGMYFEYESLAPGAIAHDFPALLHTLFAPEDPRERAARAELVSRLRLRQPPFTAAQLAALSGGAPKVRTPTGGLFGP
jgi:CDP-glycerol glycerophosphotransferase (TagB/SpsB family)